MRTDPLRRPCLRPLPGSAGPPEPGRTPGPLCGLAVAPPGCMEMPGSAGEMRPPCPRTSPVPGNARNAGAPRAAGQHAPQSFSTPPEPVRRGCEARLGRALCRARRAVFLWQWRRERGGRPWRAGPGGCGRPEGRRAGRGGQWRALRARPPEPAAPRRAHSASDSVCPVRTGASAPRCMRHCA